MCTDADAVSVAQIVPSAFLHLVYFASFFSPWVITGSRTWSLWSRCYKEEVYDAVKNTTHETKCQHIQPGDSPAYFKALQVMSGLLFGLCLLQLNVFCDNCFLDKGRVPAFMAFLSALLAATVVGVAGEHIPKDGGRLWQGEDLQMGIGFYFIIVSLVISILLAMGHLQYDQYRRREAQKSKASEERSVRHESPSKGNASANRRPGHAQATVPPSSSVSRNSVAPAPSPGLGSSSVSGAERSGRVGEDHNLKTRTAGSSHPPHALPLPPSLPPLRSPHHNPLPLFPPLPAHPPHHAQGGQTSFISQEGSRSDTSESDGSTSLPESHATNGEPVPRSLHAEGSQTSLTSQEESRSETPTSDGSISLPESDATEGEPADHSDMHHMDSVSAERLYCDNLRSVSRASMLLNRETQENHRDSPFLETAPSYTLPPSRDIQTPMIPPPAYSEAMRGEYLDMPPPPPVSVPVSHFADNNSSMYI
ncbi:uncharacterized protein LOC143289719 isoform X2 [Babylonia areolata]|uniref:uncharacterized protein LOC143289719 isoform X2 n=1 Tax=Babylonia areolata TaxID=304850 RepID=UPI003FD18B96